MKNTLTTLGTQKQNMKRQKNYAKTECYFHFSNCNKEEEEEYSLILKSQGSSNCNGHLSLKNAVSRETTTVEELKWNGCLVDRFILSDVRHPLRSNRPVNDTSWPTVY